MILDIPFAWRNGQSYELSLAIRGDQLSGSVDGEQVVSASDAELDCGGMALVIEEGCCAIARVAVTPA